MCFECLYPCASARSWWAVCRHISTSLPISFMLWGSTGVNVMRDLCAAMRNVFAPGNMNFSRSEWAKGGMITTSESYSPCCLIISKDFFQFFTFFSFWTSLYELLHDTSISLYKTESQKCHLNALHHPLLKFLLVTRTCNHTLASLIYSISYIWVSFPKM